MGELAGAVPVLIGDSDEAEVLVGDSDDEAPVLWEDSDDDLPDLYPDDEPLTPQSGANFEIWVQMLANESQLAAESQVLAARASLAVDNTVAPEPKPDVQLAPPPKKRRRLNGKQTVASVDLPPQVSRRKSEIRAAHTGLSENEVKSLMHAGWPIACFNLLSMIMAESLFPCTFPRNLYCVEFFSGVSMVAGVFRQFGLASQTFDICTHEQFENLNTAEGLCTALTLAMLLKKHGLGHFATVCSSWIFLSLGTTLRNDQNPWGALDRPSVRVANAQVVRMILVVMLLKVRGCSWLLEQPMTSRMCKVPLWDAVAPPNDFYKTSTWMGAYGAPTRKPTWLLSTEGWTTRLARTLKRDAPKGVAGTTLQMGSTIGGRNRVCGGPRLKESQAYPPGYGVAVQRYWWEHYINLNGEEDGDGEVSEVASSVSDTDYTEISTEHGDIEQACEQLGASTTTWRC